MTARPTRRVSGLPPPAAANTRAADEATTADHLAYHALVQPDAVAFITPDRQHSYAGFHTDLCWTVALVRALGVVPGSVVGICRADSAGHLLLLLACEAAGAATLSYQPGAFDRDDTALDNVSLLITDGDDTPRPPGLRCIALEATALAQYLVTNKPAPKLTAAPAHGDDVIRIDRTSGSSGRRTHLALSRAVVQGRVAHAITRTGRTHGAVEWLAAPLTVGAVFDRAHACLRLGVTLAAGPLADIAARVPVHHAWLLPTTLRDILATLAPRPGQPWVADVETAYAPLPAALRKQAEESFCTRISNQLACAEAGVISEGLDSQGRGWLGPGNDALVLDRTGRRLPLGAIGLLWVRTPTMASGYSRRSPGAPGGTASRPDRFKRGWFNTGDRVRRLAPGLLQFLGRESTLLPADSLKIDDRAIHGGVNLNKSGTAPKEPHS